MSSWAVRENANWHCLVLQSGRVFGTRWFKKKNRGADPCTRWYFVESRGFILRVTSSKIISITLSVRDNCKKVHFEGSPVQYGLGVACPSHSILGIDVLRYVWGAQKLF